MSVESDGGAARELLEDHAHDVGAARARDRLDAVRDRIAEVGPSVAIPPGARVIDLSQATVLPGMIDLHVHLFPQGPDAPGSDPAAGRRSDAGEAYVVYGNNFGSNRGAP